MSGWGFDDSVSEFDARAFAKAQDKYNKRRNTHPCSTTCKSLHGQHDFEEIWDDFNLSQRQREVIFMEVVQSRGRYHKELTLLRRYVSTVDGSFILRLQTSTTMTLEVMGDIRFDTIDESNEYYNYCIGIFKFTEVKPIVPEEEPIGFFSDLDELDGAFANFFEDDDEDEAFW